MMNQYKCNDYALSVRLAAGMHGDPGSGAAPSKRVLNG
jgi:hypothetical protein